jgi:hypothetical protein
VSLDNYKLCPQCRPQGATDGSDNIYVNCDHCGNFKLVGNFIIKHIDQKSKAILSIMTRRANEFNNQELYLDSTNFKDYIDTFNSFSLKDLSNFFIEFVGKRTSYSVWFDLPDSKAFIVASLSSQKLHFVRDFLHSEGILEIGKNPYGGQVRLTYKGWERFEDISTRINSKLCFVAIPFNPTNLSLYENHLKPLLKDELGFDSVIVSERQHNEVIVDRIIYEINRSRFVIADASDKNANVYYEAGYARGLGKTVIWICRKSEEGKIELPFDTRNINHIVWETEEDLKSQLKMRILATISVPENQNASTR